MPRLGQIAISPQGAESILTARGWVPNTPELEQAAAQGGTGAFLVNMLDSATMGMVEGLQAPAEAMGQVSPGASGAGRIAPDMLAVAGIARAGIRGAGRASVASRVAQQADEGAAAAGRSGGMFKTEQGFAKLPSDIVPEVFSGTARAIEAGIGALPGVRVATDMFKIQRQKVLGSKLQRGLGFTEREIKDSGGKLLPENIAAPLARVDVAYDSARGVIDDFVQPSQVRKVADDAAEAGLFTEQDIANFTRAQDATGDQLLTMRSELRDMSRNADNILQKRRISEIIDNIQDIINQAAEGTEVASELKQADKIYKLWKSVDGGGAIRSDGYLNLPSLRNALSKGYGTRAVKGGRGVNDPIVNDLISAVDELGQLGPGLPTSGTAERGLAAGALLGAAGMDVLP